MRTTILHAHSVHNDLNLISCRLQIEHEGIQEDFQFYTSLEAVKANPMSLESFINDCKAKAKASIIATAPIAPVVTAPVASKRTKAKAEPVVETVAPVAEVAVEAPMETFSEPAVEIASEPVVESIDATIDGFIKRRFKTKKDLVGVYGSTIVEKIKDKFKDTKVVFDKEIEAFLETVLATKEAVKEEKVEELLLKKPQTTPMLEDIQRNFLQATYNKMLAMEKFEYLKNTYHAGMCLKDLLEYKLPVKVAKRIGSGEYQIHETLESCFLGVFEARALEYPRSEVF